MSELSWLQRYVGEELVEDHLAGRLSRRDLLRQLTALCGSLTAAGVFLVACGDDAVESSPSTTAAPATAGSASATTATTGSTAAPSTTAAASTGTPGGPVLAVAANDPTLRSENVTFAGPSGQVLGYLSQPVSGGARPGVLVIHENRGLTDHIRDVARRVAKAGYIALAVDLASRAGGTAAAGANITTLLGSGPPEDRVADLDAGYAYLRSLPAFNGALGVTGFCFGGGVTMLYAAFQPAVRAAVPYYGTPPTPIDIMRNARAAFLVHYGGTDTRVNATKDAVDAALAHTVHELVVHDGAGHAFNNDTGGAYNEAAAVAAWRRTLAWFAMHLA